MKVYMPMWLEAVDTYRVIPTVKPLRHRRTTRLQEDIPLEWIESQVLCELGLISFRIEPNS